jgi:Calx-beta domain
MRGISWGWRRLAVAGAITVGIAGVGGGAGTLLAHSAASSTGASCAPAGTAYTHIRMSPGPIATAGSLTGGQSVNWFAQALDGTLCVPGATMYLFEVSSVKGDLMTVSAAQCGGKTQVTSTPIACIADSTGKVQVTYTAPTTIPDNGVNEVEAGDTPTHPHVNGIDFYLYEMIYTFSRSPIDPNGSMTAGQTQTETLQASGVAGNPEVGFKVYLSLKSTASHVGSATVGTTALTTQPKAFTTDSNGQINMTYKAPSTIPTTGIDTIFAGSGTTATPAVFQTASYDFAASDPVISIGDQAQVEGDTHPDILAEFNVTVSAPQTKAITLQYLTVCGIGDKGCKEDYLQSLEPTPRTLTIPAGQVSAKINIKMYSYVAEEPYNEGYFIQLLTPSFGVTGRELAQGTLLGDDETTTADILYIGDTAVVCGNSGTQFAEFTVTLSSPETGPVTFHYTTQDGSALAGTDYSAVSGTATIPAGDSSFHIQVPILAHPTAASTKTFMVNISAPTGATIERPSGVGTILNWVGQ